jgi:hypothetical protein
VAAPRAGSPASRRTERLRLDDLFFRQLADAQRRSRATHGAMPMTMSAILEVSSSPSTMNNTGRMASGGIIAIVLSSGDSNRRRRGTTPIPTASSIASVALIASAAPIRFSWPRCPPRTAHCRCGDLLRSA